MRDGIVIEIPSREVTIGDEVHLEAGDFIPADGRIIECSSLKVDESALTGESLAVEKTEETLEGELPLGDQKEHGLLRKFCNLRKSKLCCNRYCNGYRSW